MRKVDLHSHSHYSDGTLSPAELVEVARREGVEVLALTDHDTTAGVEEAAAAAGRLGGIRLVPGIEVSAFDADCKSIHILGLGLRDLPKLAALEEGIRRGRRRRNEAIIDGYNRKYGRDISLEAIERNFRGTIGDGNLRQYFVGEGLAGSFDEAGALFAEFKDAARYAVTVPEAIEAIHAAGGLAFLAHPCTLKLDDGALWEKVRGFKEAGLDGIECFHTKHSAAQAALYLDFAKRLELLASGGSDFHGALKPDVKLCVGKSDRPLADPALLAWLASI